jgi:hypothetical protein
VKRYKSGGYGAMIEDEDGKWVHVDELDAQQPTWQPIETAPKDIYVLAWWPRMNPESACIAIFSASSFDEDGRFIPTDGSPALWMPLPAPPSALKDEVCAHGYYGGCLKDEP